MEPAELEERLQALHNDSFSWALTCCAGHSPDAEDVLQTVYLQILQGKARFGGHAEFKTWLFAVIRNQAAKEVRRQILRRIFFVRQQQEPVSHPSIPLPDATLQKTERDHAFDLAINALPSRQRE